MADHGMYDIFRAKIEGFYTDKPAVANALVTTGIVQPRSVVADAAVAMNPLTMPPVRGSKGLDIPSLS